MQTQGRRRFGLDGTLLRTAVGRRIVGLFFLCALVPTSLIAIVGYRLVSAQLERQNDESLRVAAKTAGLGVLRRLDQAETRLVLLALQLPLAGTRWQSDVFRTIALVDADDVTVYGRESNSGFVVPDLTPSDLAHLGNGGVLLRIDSIAAPADRLLLGMRPDTSSDRLIWGVLDAGHVWGESGPDNLPAGVSPCVLSESLGVLYCPLDGSVRLRQTLDQVRQNGDETRFEWTDDDNARHIATRWTVFLRSRYGHDPLIVLANQRHTDVFAAQAAFSAAFVKILLVALVVVLLLSNIQIRRSLQPLEALKRGTELLAGGNLGAQVIVNSKDEFGELASSFNAMSSRIDRQFRELDASHEVDLAIISSLDRDTIIDTVLANAGTAVAADSTFITLLDAPGARTGRTFLFENGVKTSRAARLTEHELHIISASPHGRIAQDPLGGAHRGRLPASSPARIETWNMLPIFHRGGVTAVLGFGRTRGQADHEDSARASRFTHKVAVALANTRLLEELDALSWGAMTAFARAIDAKSHWTAGHSERVTSISVGIARRLGLSENDIDIVRCGAILHDIGKIGVPAEILDKPGSLTDAEMALVREHPRIGTRILEPIPQYKDVLPIVLYHHERLDGTGYPEKLSGKAVPLLARIVAVADVFDALGSDRPYRTGMPADTVARIIRKDSGVGFDAAVVEALFAMLDDEPAGQDSDLVYEVAV